jgi:hypothetical protein
MRGLVPTVANGPTPGLRSGGSRDELWRLIWLGLGLSGLPGCSDSNDTDTIRDTNAGGQKAKVIENAPSTLRSIPADAADGQRHVQGLRPRQRARRWRRRPQVIAALRL